MLLVCMLTRDIVDGATGFNPEGCTVNVEMWFTDCHDLIVFSALLAASITC